MIQQRLFKRFLIAIVGFVTAILLTPSTWVSLLNSISPVLKDRVLETINTMQNKAGYAWYAFAQFCSDLAHSFHKYTDPVLNRYFGYNPDTDGFTGIIIVAIMCYFQGYVIVWLTKKLYEKFSIYSTDRIINTGKLKDGVVLVLEPRKDIYITSQQEALRVLKLLRNFNRKAKAAALRREMSMTLLLDENKKLLLALIDNIGSTITVVPTTHEVVYSYNVSFNGRCRSVIVAHTHPGIVPPGSKLYTYSYPLPSQNDRRYHLELQKAIYPVKVIDHFVLPAIDSVSPYSIVHDSWLPVKSKRLKPYPGRFFKVIYNGFKENKTMMPTMLGVKLKYQNNYRPEVKQEVGDYENIKN